MLAIFFDGAPHYTEARQLCGVCPVQAECLEYALEQDIAATWDYQRTDGFWGGKTRNERARLVEERRNG